ncbi:MAG: hypothetical protein ACYTGS_03220 [Planctomycetota bacterium]
MFFKVGRQELHLFHPSFRPVSALLPGLSGRLYQGLDMPRQFRDVNFTLLSAMFSLAFLQDSTGLVSVSKAVVKSGQNAGGLHAQLAPHRLKLNRQESEERRK